MNGKHFIVSGGTPVVFAPFDHEENGAQEPMCQSDNGSFVAAPNNERHVTCRLAVKFADYHAQTNAAIGGQIVQTTFLRNQLPHQFLPRPGNQTRSSIAIIKGGRAGMGIYQLPR